MVANTSIEWADHTFNPWMGCTRVSPACDHCYAAVSTPARTMGVEWGVHAERRRTSASTWAQPRKWNRDAATKGIRYRVFCASLADVFDNAVPEAWRRDLFALIGETPHLDWLLLTKRIGNAVDMLPTSHLKAPRPNVWLGSTVVTQAEADRDVPKLLATPAARRFLSMEPLLGPVDLTRIGPGQSLGGRADAEHVIHALHGGVWDQLMRCRDSDGPRLDWVIVGGESGPGARPMHPDWARSLRDQCAAAGVPFLFKQWGEWAPGESAGSTLSKPLVRTADWFDNAWAYEDVRGDYEWYADDEPTLYRVGKKAAGRLLDGVQHDGVPEAAAA